MTLLDINRPQFIVFEGMDYSGKSTLADGLMGKIMKTNPVKTFANPGGDEFGRRLRALIKSNPQCEKDVELMLFYANRLHLSNLVKREMDYLSHVIVDRWDISSHVYQRGEREGILKDRLYYGITPLHEGMFDLPTPNVYIYLDVDKKTVKERSEIRSKYIAKDRYEWKDGEFDTWYDDYQYRYRSIVSYFTKGEQWKELYDHFDMEDKPYRVFACPIHKVMGKKPADYIISIKMDNEKKDTDYVNLIYDLLFVNEDVNIEYPEHLEQEVLGDKVKNYIEAANTFFDRK